MELPASTKAYNPQMLHHAFDWDSDLPEWDGLICRVDTPEGVIVSQVSDPIALTWRNSSTIVVEKRSRPPTSLFGAATKQIRGGEIGIVYLAYNEGAREEIADRRSPGRASCRKAPQVGAFGDVSHPCRISDPPLSDAD
ncbi:hypothetical protein [Sphingomonas sp. 22R3R2A-7]|uniref:hypothetical protein n=1 Tax=Sphingomonas sp. 22R3R2A-7 TaxID=3050230 RepID=UPI002FE25980